MGGIVLDCHPPASAVTALTAGEVHGQVFFPHGQPSGDAVEDHGHPPAGRLAGVEQPEGHAGPDARSSAARITSTGAFLPVHISNDAAPWYKSMARPSVDRRLRRSKRTWSGRSKDAVGRSAGVALMTRCALATASCMWS